MGRGNPYPHRYKYGKIEKAVNLEVLGKLMEKVNQVDCSGYGARFIQAVLAIAYWTGFRSSEVLGDSGQKWKLKKGGFRQSKPFPGLFKENMWVDNGFLFIRQEARKHGHREDPVALPLTLPYVDLLVERWNQTKPGAKVFPIDQVVCWRIFKRIDPKLYWHLFCFTRVTKLSEDKRNSLADIVRFTGKDPKTIGWYMSRSGRDSQEIGERMKTET
jgi:hypothetical protein